jgi:methionyl-tRNA synthetase
MSKSLGNSVDPTEIITEYGADPLRYYLLRHVPSYADGDFSNAAFEASYNNELANELGNALSRTMAMVDQFQNGQVGKLLDSKLDTSPYEKSLQEFHFDKALEFVFDRVRGVNQFIEEKKPWQMAKDDKPDQLQEVLAHQVSELLQIADLLEPFLPSTSEKIKKAFSDGKTNKMSETLFPRRDHD